MSLLQKAFSSRFKRQIFDMTITKFLPFVCLETAFEYQQCKPRGDYSIAHWSGPHSKV